MDLAEFLDRYPNAELPEWMAPLVEKVMAGERVQIHMPRSRCRYLTYVTMAALHEAMGERWDVVPGNTEASRQVRRAARELAARIAG